MTATYQEPIGRYVVEKLENYEGLPEFRAELKLKGMDPDNNWLLVWSFEEEQLACEKMSSQSACDRLHRRWRVRDRGADAPKHIEWLAIFG